MHSTYIYVAQNTQLLQDHTMGSRLSLLHETTITILQPGKNGNLVSVC